MASKIIAARIRFMSAADYNRGLTELEMEGIDFMTGVNSDYKYDIRVVNADGELFYQVLDRFLNYNIDFKIMHILKKGDNTEVNGATNRAES